MSFKPGPLTDNTTGAASQSLSALAAVEQKEIFLQLADIVNSGAWTIGIPTGFVLQSALFRTGKPASASSKAATLTLSTSGGALTGGVISLTTANQNTTGGTVAASAISGANATVVGAGTIIATASSVTAFTEGDGWLELTYVNSDLANALSSLADKINKISSQL